MAFSAIQWHVWRERGREREREREYLPGKRDVRLGEVGEARVTRNERVDREAVVAARH